MLTERRELQGERLSRISSPKRQLQTRIRRNPDELGDSLAARPAVRESDAKRQSISIGVIVPSRR
jgi:hypothetical protein